MEDSLRRLREVRRGGGSGSSLQTSNQTQYVDGLHSDDKIRHQLYLDATAYSDEVKKLWGLNRECICELDSFIEEIDATRTESHSNNMPTVSQT